MLLRPFAGGEATSNYEEEIRKKNKTKQKNKVVEEMNYNKFEVTPQIPWVTDFPISFAASTVTPSTKKGMQKKEREQEKGLLHGSQEGGKFFLLQFHKHHNN